MLKMGFALTIILLICGMLAGCDFSTNPVIPTPTIPPPSPTPRTINITRQEFDEAKAKWQALGVQEYSIRVEYVAYRDIMADWTLHVRSENGKSEVLDFVREPGTAPPTGYLGPESVPTTPDQIEYARKELNTITIEAMLQMIEEHLKDNSPTCCLNVRFEPDTGKLLSVSTGNNGPGTEPWHWTLKDLAILKQSAP